jgi:oligopeptide/dipeptide ABC transporter ATP-binding protein
MNEALIKVRGLKIYFPSGDKHFPVRAVDDISFDVLRGETLGVVGESGCGKSTTGRAVIHMLHPTGGEVEFAGINLGKLPKKELRTMRRRMQVIFQDPYASLDPRKNVLQIIAEPFMINEPGMSGKEMEKRVKELIDLVGLRPEHIRRYPHEFSGGQRQRIGIARAIALNPDFIVCDEPVSALDVSIQAQVINLMRDLKNELGLTYMFISHDLRIIKHICDRVMVMYLGSIVELSSRKSIYENPRHPYTKALLSAIPNIYGSKNENRVILTGDIPSPMKPPPGCSFHPRCMYCREICTKVKPSLREYEDGTCVACHWIEQQSGVQS